MPTEQRNKLVPDRSPLSTLPYADKLKVRIAANSDLKTRTHARAHTCSILPESDKIAACLEWPMTQRSDFRIVTRRVPLKLCEESAAVILTNNIRKKAAVANAESCKIMWSCGIFLVGSFLWLATVVIKTYIFWHMGFYAGQLANYANFEFISCGEKFALSFHFFRLVFAVPRV